MTYAEPGQFLSQAGMQQTDTMDFSEVALELGKINGLTVFSRTKMRMEGFKNMPPQVFTNRLLETALI